MSLTSYDILVSLRQFINSNLDGLLVSYQECKTDEEQDGFIEACKYLVVNGWDNNFNPEMTVLVRTNDFLSSVLGPILISPQTFFANRELNDTYLQLAKYFARYCVFRTLFEMYKDRIIKSENIDLPLKKNWFLVTKEKLDQEFRNGEFAVGNLIFKFNTPKDLIDFENSLNRKSTCTTILLVSAYASLMLAVGVGSFYYPPLIHRFEKFVILAIGDIAVRRYDKQIKKTHMLFKSKLELLTLQTDRDLKKFILLTKDEILKAIDNNTNETHDDFAGVLSK